MQRCTAEDGNSYVKDVEIVTLDGLRNSVQNTHITRQEQLCAKCGRLLLVGENPQLGSGCNTQ